MAAPLTVQVIALDGEAENEAPKPFRFPDKSVRHAQELFHYSHLFMRM